MRATIQAIRSIARPTRTRSWPKSAPRTVRVQFDLYHCQIVEGDVAAKLRYWVGVAQSNVGHIQIAGPPDRIEPDSGELNYAWLLPLIDELGYEGWVGCGVPTRRWHRGGPWLGASVGDPPAGCRVVRFAGGSTPDRGKPEYWDGDIPWVSPKDMKRHANR